MSLIAGYIFYSQRQPLVELSNTLTEKKIEKGKKKFEIHTISQFHQTKRFANPGHGYP